MMEANGWAIVAALAGLFISASLWGWAALSQGWIVIYFAGFMVLYLGGGMVKDWLRQRR